MIKDLNHDADSFGEDLTDLAAKLLENVSYGTESQVSRFPSLEVKPKSLKELARVTKAKSAQGLSGKEFDAAVGQDLTLYEVFAHRVRVMDDETGELRHAVRTVFEIGDGRYLTFVSDAAAEFADLLLEYNPSGNFHGSLIFRFYRVERTRRGRRTYSFEVVGGDEIDG